MTIEQRNTRGILGLPYTYTEELAKEIESLSSGDCPPVTGVDFPLEVNQDLKANTVMAMKGNGRLVQAEAFLESPGAVASGSFTVTGNDDVRSAFTVGGRTYETSEGDTEARAAELARLVNDDRYGPCFATVAAAVVTLRARFPGTSGNGAISAVAAGTKVDLTGGTGGNVPVGILTHDRKSGASELQTVGIYVSGMFNPERLIWHSSFTTDEIKRHAFLNTLSMTQIFLRKIRNLNQNT